MSILNNKPWIEHCGQALAVGLAEQSQLMLDATRAVFPIQWRGFFLLLVQN